MKTAEAEFTLQQIKDFDAKGYTSVAARMVRSLLIHYRHKPLPPNIQEALNSGDGVYRP